MILDHFEAFKAHVAGIAGIPAVDEVTRVTDSGEPVKANYVIVYPPTIPGLNDYRYSAGQRATSTALFRWDVRPVATTASAVLRFTDRILGASIGERLSVPARRLDPMWLVEGVEEGDVGYDRTSRLFYLDFTIEAVSRRA